MKSVVVLGGYGNFGRRVVAALASDADYRLLIAGRNREQAEHLARKVRGSAEPLVIDCHAPSLSEELVRVEASVVIHTAGPFQAQSYCVPRACIAAHCHYLDLADARAFVCGIRALNDAAKRSDVLIVSGASSLPALSSAAIDRLAAEFSSIDMIEHDITSGATPPGKATMNGVLAYAGRPLAQWRGGGWHRGYGWQDLTLRRYPEPVGMRYIATCDVPDLELFPQRYAPVKTVIFRAGVAQPSSMLAIWLAAWAVRLGWMKSLGPHVPRLHSLALARARSGSKDSAMHVAVHGLDVRSKPISRTWTLIAGSDHGPFIPCLPAIALARKLMRNEITMRGATPCMGLLTVDEILDVGHGLDIAVL